MEQRPELIDKFIAYMRAMYPFILAAYGNPPEFVRITTTSLKDAVSVGVPPADIGNEWFDILRWVFLQGIDFTHDRDGGVTRILPTENDMARLIEKYWNSI